MLNRAVANVRQENSADCDLCLKSAMLLTYPKDSSKSCLSLRVCNNVSCHDAFFSSKMSDDRSMTLEEQVKSLSDELMQCQVCVNM